MSTRNFALIVGISMIIGGVLGFAPPLVTPGAEVHPLSPDHEFDQLFGLFPMSPVDNVLHIALGAWGVYASRLLRSSVLFSRWLAAILFALTIAGFVPVVGDGFGLLPLYGNDIWLHGVMSLVAAYFGWVHRSPMA